MGKSSLREEPTSVKIRNVDLIDHPLPKRCQRTPLANSSQRVRARGQLRKIPLQPEVQTVLRVSVSTVDEVEFIPLGLITVFVAPPEANQRESTSRARVSQERGSSRWFRTSQLHGPNLNTLR